MILKMVRRLEELTELCVKLERYESFHDEKDDASYLKFVRTIRNQISGITVKMGRDLLPYAEGEHAATSRDRPQAAVAAKN